jgi:hypothetical protein
MLTAFGRCRCGRPARNGLIRDRDAVVGTHTPDAIIVSQPQAQRVVTERETMTLACDLRGEELAAPLLARMYAPGDGVLAVVVCVRVAGIGPAQTHTLRVDLRGCPAPMPSPAPDGRAARGRGPARPR